MNTPDDIVKLMQSIVETYYLSVQTKFKLHPDHSNLHSVLNLSLQVQQDFIDAIKLLQSLDRQLRWLIPYWDIIDDTTSRQHN